MDQWVAPGQIIKNQINLDLIEIIQFCLKIYDLLKHPHLWVGVWVVGWMGGLICGSMVGHFWTFLLKPPQPLMGLFLDPVRAAEVARLKAWTGTLLKRHGLDKKGQQGGVGGSS